MTTIGVDLGTTNSLVAVWEEGSVKVIPNALGELLTPSVISVLENGDVLVGQAAKDRLISHPQVTISQFKRLMGTREEVKLGRLRFTPEALSSLVLRQLREDAETYLGAPVNEAIISVPAYFNDNQRNATRVAGEMAGFKVERLINEPTAAALAYGVSEEGDEETSIVLDLGGGTFDVSILEKFDNLMEVHASAGDAFLGGEDFTRLLLNDFLREHDIDKKTVASTDLARLYKLAELVKVKLTSAGENNLEVAFDLANESYRSVYSSARFTELAEPLISRLLAPIERAIRDARVEVKDLERIFLVGGATRMPIVRNLVTRLFGRFPEYHIDPDHAVVMGAAVQAALKSRNQEFEDVVLTDVCPFSLGIGLYNDVYSVIIERNRVIPVSREEVYQTVQDKQKEIKVVIYQGEHRLVSKNVSLGELTIPVPKKKAGEAKITVRFTYDINGLLEVIVTSLDNQKSRTVVIENSPGRLTQQEINKALSQLEHIKLHPRDDAKNKALVARAERLYQERLGDERDAIGEAIADFEASLETQDPQLVQRAAIHIERYLDELETDLWR